MGTRSLTHVKADRWREGDEAPTLVTIYRQFDGYPTGIGDELAAFLRGRKVVNGFGSNDGPKVSNGMGCLAASLIGALKGDEPGNVYIYRLDASDCGEEYVYTISNDSLVNGNSALRLRCEGYGKVLFDGPPEDFVGSAVEAQ